MWPFKTKEEAKQPHIRAHLPPFKSTKACPACGHKRLSRHYARGTYSAIAYHPSCMAATCKHCGYVVQEQLLCDAVEIAKRNE